MEILLSVSILSIFIMFIFYKLDQNIQKDKIPFHDRLKKDDGTNIAFNPL